jgi:hypothetical protein
VPVVGVDETNRHGVCLRTVVVAEDDALVVGVGTVCIDRARCVREFE